MKNQLNLQSLILTVLRVLVGSHFIFEGISRLVSSNWPGSTYLMEPGWLFPGFFHWIIGNPSTLSIVDFLNVWGFILIGTVLFLGIFIRAASISGILLLLLFYISNEPFVNSNLAADVKFFIIRSNIIDAVLLLTFATFRKDYLWSLDRLIKLIFQVRKDRMFPLDDNHADINSGLNRRREFIKNLAIFPLLGPAFFGMAKKNGWMSFEEDNLERAGVTTKASVLTSKAMDISQLNGKVPMGKIRNVKISRLIPGGNIISAQAHSRDLIYVSPLIKEYFTDEKVIETFWLYEACGINTTILSTREQTLRVLKEFWRRGGKLQWVAQTYPNDNDFYSNIQLAIDNGAIGAFVEGGIAMKWAAENHLENLAKPIEYIKSKGLIAGTAGHTIEVPVRCVENGIKPDFFMKTFHHNKYWSASSPDRKDHDNSWCASAEEVADFFKTCKIPWIAYKTLAAGAIKPEVGLKFAYENGADFACVGMFDFQVIDNANIVCNILESDLSRERKWYG